MDEFSHRNFGLTIAYVLPGFVVLWTASYFSDSLGQWLATAPQSAPSIGSFLYGLLGSLGAGLIVSAVRWATIDTFNEWTGLARPKFDYSELQENLQAFDNAVEYHYRYYQFYSNMAVAFVGAVAARWLALPSDGIHVRRIAAFCVLEAVLLAGARDALRKYYERLTHLLGATL
jgi:phosphotransferase system  glucose/maltose/N-acetylglucosamine-specific IIC component